jgi:hypothetical protein
MFAAADSGLTFVSDPDELPGLEIRVNFGVFAGRAVTPAEIDRLALLLLDMVDRVSIVSEERHEIGPGSEAMVHLVRVALESGNVPLDDGERQALIEGLVERTNHWARACIADRPSLSAGL